MRTTALASPILMIIFPLGGLGGLGCLSPLTDDTVDPSHFFGDPKVDPSTLHIEDDPAFAPRVAKFGDAVAYLEGFADHQAIRYWNTNGPDATFIAPMFEITDANGAIIGEPIIDAIPGDSGYTPWWRRNIVRVTSKYAGERIWSREAIDAALRAGLVTEPEEQAEVVDCPVVLRKTTVPVDFGRTVPPQTAWYRNHQVSWVEFAKKLPVPKGVREMPNHPVYVLQRINQAAPIYEFLTGVDLNKDGDLKDTNNIFASNIDGPEYSTLWYVTVVHVTANYPSIDNTRTGTVGLSAESDFLDSNGSIISPWVAAEGLTPMKSFLVNCPIQSMKGSL